MRSAMMDDSEYLTSAEVASLLGRLGKADILRLTAIAGAWVRICPRRDPMDMFDEVVARVLSGRRSWPADVGLVPFMHQVMRSIAHQWRVEDQRELVGIKEDVIDDREDTTADFEARDLIDRMRLSLSDDAEALGVFEQQLLQTGKTEAQTRLGLSATVYDTARRRMIRSLRRRFTAGWKS